MTWRQLQGWITSLPLGLRRAGHAAGLRHRRPRRAFPFTSPGPARSPPATPAWACCYGLNLASPGVVVWDRWAQDNYNAVILARSGAGKSYLAKLDLLRNLYLGVEAFVIDPEDEYLALAETVGGTVIRPGAPGVRINPLDLPPGDGDDALDRRAQFMQTFATVLAQRDGDRRRRRPLPGDEAAAAG